MFALQTSIGRQLTERSIANEQAAIHRKVIAN